MEKYGKEERTDLNLEIGVNQGKKTTPVRGKREDETEGVKRTSGVQKKKKKKKKKSATSGQKDKKKKGNYQSNVPKLKRKAHGKN